MTNAPVKTTPGDSPAPGRTTIALPTALGVLIGLAMLIIIIQGLNQVESIKAILASLFMAVNLVIVVWPIQSRLARRLPRILASIMAGFTAIAVFAVLIWSIGWAITRLVAELPNYSVAFQKWLNTIVDFLARQGLNTNTIYTEALAQLRSLNLTTIANTLSSVAAQVSSVVNLVVLVIMILVFVIMDSASFGDRMSRLSEKHNPALAAALTSFARGTRRYWVVATVFGLIVAAFDWVLLLALSVPLASVWAVFAFVTNYIPNVGFVIGLIPPVIMAFLAGGWQTALWVVVGYCLLNVIIQGFIQPRVTGGAVGITATVAVLSLLLWATILGPLGALLAIPATLLVKTLFIDMDPTLRWMNTIIASDMVTSEQDPSWLSQLLDRAKGQDKSDPVGAPETADNGGEPTGGPAGEGDAGEPVGGPEEGSGEPGGPGEDDGGPTVGAEEGDAGEPGGPAEDDGKPVSGATEDDGELGGLEEDDGEPAGGPEKEEAAAPVAETVPTPE
ncbi:MAG: AI-2E family transporter [Propionibacteriaceae bacterium]|jgi:predicted PurR-regulated permease PerM|nr:AI-2E family transporter [Propionibacteriaceae bacterium]